MLVKLFVEDESGGYKMVEEFDSVHRYYQNDNIFMSNKLYWVREIFISTTYTSLIVTENSALFYESFGIIDMIQ